MRVSRPVLRERGGEIPPRYSPPIYQRSVESVQCCRLDDRAKLRDTPRIHEQRRDPEHKTIKRSEIGRSLSGSIANQQLMLENQGLCGDGAGTTRAEELYESDDQVNRQDE